MDLARMSLAWSVLTLVGCATSTPASPPEESLGYEGSLAQEILECQLTDEECLSRVQDIRHQQQTQAKLDEIVQQGEQIRREQSEQHEQRMRAIYRAAGLDPDAGQGFWCFTGHTGERSLVECRRTLDSCADQAVARHRQGKKIEGNRCEEYAQAACFRVTRTLKEGERTRCYGDLGSCETIQHELGIEGFVSPPTTCRITD